MDTSNTKRVRRTNSFGQPIGFPVPSFVKPDENELHVPMTGRVCELQPLDKGRHMKQLFEAFAEDDGRMWTYLRYEKCETLEEFEAKYFDKLFDYVGKYFAIVDKRSGNAVGVAMYLRIDPPLGSVEIGNLAFSPSMQRSTISTEAMYLMIKRSFELGFRRCEWKCDSLNVPSANAALRLGFKFEGTFRQSMVYKGRNRDTKWFSILDCEWPQLEKAFQQWLREDNFDSTGKQILTLSKLQAEAGVSKDEIL